MTSFTDDEYYNHTILNYVQIAEQVKKLDPYDRYLFIKYLEYEYDNEADTLLGDFLDEMVQLFVTSLYEEDLYADIETILDASDLNIDLAYTVSKTILETMVS